MECGSVNLPLPTQLYVYHMHLVYPLLDPDVMSYIEGLWLWAMNNEQWAMNSKHWTMSNEQWTMSNEQWAMNNEQWTMNNEQWTMNNEQ